MFDNPEEVYVMKIAVVRTGTLGLSITQVFCQCNKIEKVYLCKGRWSSERDSKKSLSETFDKLVAKGKMTRKDADSFLAKIIMGTKDNAKNADLLVEAVSENLEIKQAVFKELDRICGPQCIFTTNTSSLPIQVIGAELSRPLVGMHFFNPAPVMKLVEVIVTDKVPQETIDVVMKVAMDIGKIPVEVREAPGFVVNRVLIPMINEAVGIYSEGIASVEDIDTAMKLGANHPMGPLALGDLIGLDVVLAILNVMLKETGDNRYLPQPMLKKMVREKKLGKKTGQGFYQY